MSRRTHEAPMDFQFENGTGPVDMRSPFAAVSMNTQRFPNATSSKSPFKSMLSSKTGDITVADAGVDAGSQSAFDSPSRPSHAQPHHARPQSSSPAKALPPVPAFNALFSTPRKPVAEFDDSSAGETPKSPNRDDSDATPDTTNLRTAVSRLTSKSVPALPVSAKPMPPPKEQPPSSPDRRDSFFGRLKTKFYSPGRGEVPRGGLTHVKENRVRKVKSRETRHRSGRNRRNSISSSASDDEAGNRRTSPQKSPRKISSSQNPQQDFIPPRSSRITDLFTFIASHPTVPHILSFYAQLAFNVFLLTACAYIIYSFWAAIRGDIDKKAWEASADILADINSCAEHYRLNGCASPTRAPALEQVCAEWSRRMNQDYKKVGRARVSAQAFAEIFNSFVEPISYKAMIFTLLIVFGCFGISNFAFGLLRDKTAQTQHYNPNPYGWQPPPPTPQRSFSGGDGGFYSGTPWHMQTPGLEPAPSGGLGHIEGRGSPVRRLVYN